MEDKKKLLTLLSGVLNEKGQRRFVYDAPKGGGRSFAVAYIALVILPPLAYFTIFHTSVFDALGIFTLVMLLTVTLSPVIIALFLAMLWHNRYALRILSQKWSAATDRVSLEELTKHLESCYKEAAKSQAMRSWKSF